MSIAQKTDHTADALARLLEQFKGRAKLESLIESYIDQIQKIENVVWDLHEDRHVDSAAGVNLDKLGELVGQDREGRTDPVYRNWIKARIIINRSSGKPAEMYRIGELILDTLDHSELEEQYPAAVVFRAFEVSTDATALAELLNLATPAGVRFILEWSDSAETELFRFSDDLTLPEADGFAYTGQPQNSFTQLGSHNDFTLIREGGGLIAGAFDGDDIRYSSDDGETWTTSAKLWGGSSAAISALHYSDGVWYAGSESGRFAVSYNNWANWLELDTGFGEEIVGIAASSDIITVVTAGKRVAHSQDGGVTWPTSTIFGGEDFQGIVWNEVQGLFVIVTDLAPGTRIRTSPDATIWTIRLDDSAGNPRAITQTPDQSATYVCGLNGLLYSSADGTSWSDLDGVLADNSNYIDIAAGPSPNTVYMATDTDTIVPLSGSIITPGFSGIESIVLSSQGLLVSDGDPHLIDLRGGVFAGAIAP